MSFDTEYLDCPLCGIGDFDRIGMALHFRDCEDAEKLASAYQAEESARREKMLARIDARPSEEANG